MVYSHQCLRGSSFNGITSATWLVHAKSRFVDKSSNWVTRKQGNWALSWALVCGSEKTLCKTPVENYPLKKIIPPSLREA